MIKKLVGAVYVAFVLAACEVPETGSEVSTAAFVRISDGASFAQLIADKRLEVPDKPDRWFRLNANGTIVGDVGKGKVSGTWNFENGFWCRTLVAGVSSLGQDCQLVEHKPGVARFTREEGKGGSGEYLIK